MSFMLVEMYGGILKKYNKTWNKIDKILLKKISILK